MDDADETWGVVLAAGSGSRYGERKQFRALGGRRLVDWSVMALQPVCSGVVLVLPAEAQWDGPEVDVVVPGGETRIESARRGLEAVPATAAYVLVHDAAHPLASRALVESLLSAVRELGVDAALPVLSTRETVMRVDQDHVIETIPREGLVTVQTPQAFRAKALRAAHRRGGQVSDDSVLVQQMGATIRAVPGEPGNIHITTVDELAIAERLQGCSSSRLSGRPSTPATGDVLPGFGERFGIQQSPSVHNDR